MNNVKLRHRMDEDILSRLKGRIPEYSDQEIIEILKKRDHYNPAVAQLAIDEAIKRGLINSESDLVAPEYRTEKLRFHLFPPIQKPESKDKVIRSLSRGILLAGIIPTIYGMMKFAENKLMESFLLVTMGGIWIASSALLMKSRKSYFVYIIMAMAMVSIVYVVLTFLRLKGIPFMDYFVALIVYCLIYYGLFYVKKLISS